MPIVLYFLHEKKLLCFNLPSLFHLRLPPESAMCSIIMRHLHAGRCSLRATAITAPGSRSNWDRANDEGRDSGHENKKHTSDFDACRSRFSVRVNPVAGRSAARWRVGCEKDHLERAYGLFEAGRRQTHGKCSSGGEINCHIRYRRYDPRVHD